MNVKYQEPENINKKKVFLINRSRIEDRLDPGVYQESFRYVSNIIHWYERDIFIIG